MNLEIAKEPIKNEKPYEIQLPYGCVKLRCDWPKNVPPRILRGAVIAELMRVSNNNLHIDFHNHGPDEAIEGRPAQVFYRTRQGAEIYCIGPRAYENIEYVRDNLKYLKLTQEHLLLRGCDVQFGSHTVKYEVEQWHSYRFLTPMYPRERAIRTRPDDRRYERAWLEQQIMKDIRSSLGFLGIEDKYSRLNVSVESYKLTKSEWARPDQNIKINRHSYLAEFITNVSLPAGFAIGKHRAEGMGEIMPCL